MPGVAAAGMLPSKAALQGAAMQIEQSATSISWIPSAEQLSELAQGHHREGSAAGR
jgi:hypothetical protein